MRRAISPRLAIKTLRKISASIQFEERAAVVDRVAVFAENRDDAPRSARTHRIADAERLDVGQFAVGFEQVALDRGGPAQVEDADQVGRDRFQMASGRRFRREGRGVGEFLVVGPAGGPADLDPLALAFDANADEVGLDEGFDQISDPGGDTVGSGLHVGHERLGFGAGPQPPLWAGRPPEKGMQAGPAEVRKVALFLYPVGLDIGPFPDLFARAGLEPREVNYARLGGLGGIAAIERNPVPVIAIAPDDASSAWLADEPHVIAILRPPIDRIALLAAVRAALAADASFAHERLAGESRDLLEIARALSSERDVPTLQQLIVRKARELTRADGGSLYVVEAGEAGKLLRFSVAQTGPSDRGIYLGSMLPLSTESIAGYVATTARSVRVEDAYALPEGVPYRFNATFDKASHYRTKSMLCVPMTNARGEVVGAIQLINRKPRFDLVLGSPEHTIEVVEGFDDHDEQVLLALASQAAVAMENARLVLAIQDLFETFVRASVKAIEVRDAATQGHSERVAALTVAQAETLNGIRRGPFADAFFTPDHLRELRYASLLHDFGKVAVPEYIFAKAKKLPDGRLDTVRLRFLLAIEQCRDAGERAELLALLAKVEAANEPAVVAAEAEAAIEDARRRMFRDGFDVRPLLDDRELEYLTIPRGSLSDDERDRMQEHVTQSFLFLREIPWQTTPWPNVAELAYGHHEHLDGTGYPRRLSGDQIQPQVRMMTISDVFDALTAGDRPYKKALSVERALDILTKEFAQRGKIDPDLLDVFIEKRVYDVTATRAS